jgi:RimJ/RimL family protein N-acetyltransferase
MQSTAPADIIVTQLTPSDRAAIEFSLRRLGAQSRYQRFLGAKTAFSRRELDRMTHIDHWHRESLIARSPVPRAPIGIAEYVRREEFDVADIAVAVVDEWQRRGVGTQLVRALRSRAISAGVRRFTATVLAENKGALALLGHLGPYEVTSVEGPVLELEIDLDPLAAAQRSAA